MRSLCAAALVAAGATRAAAQESVITPALLERHIRILADDSMRGRATPSPEIETAARYVEGIFRRARLEPAGDSGRFIQRFPIGGSTAPNVVGILRGADARLRDSFIVVVAHLDHTGVGRPVDGDSIRNGADDNASGSSGLLAIVEAMSGARRPSRSILFLSVSGEERGLVGSRYYVGHPTVPLDRIVGLVNLDMIGRNTPDSIYLNGWGKSSLSDLVRRLADEHRELRLAVGPDIEDRPVTPADSDHWPFQARGVPYIFFYSGEHPDYHRPGDEPSKIDFDKASRVARLAYFTVLSAANDPAAPSWVPGSRRLNVTQSP